MVKEKEAHIEQLMQEFEIERTELAKVTTEREVVSTSLSVLSFHTFSHI